MLLLGEVDVAEQLLQAALDVAAFEVAVAVHQAVEGEVQQAGDFLFGAELGVGQAEDLGDGAH